MRTRWSWLAVVLPLLLGACPSAHNKEEGVVPPPVAATSVYVGLHCGPRDNSPEVSWIDNGDDYRALQRQLKAHAMESIGELERIDFTHQGVVVVELGRRPTTGYNLSLGSPRVAIDPQGTATLEVRLRRPETGSVTAPMLTHPCLVVWLPRAGYHRIEVLDDTGKRLGAVHIP